MLTATAATDLLKQNLESYFLFIEPYNKYMRYIEESIKSAINNCCGGCTVRKYTDKDIRNMEYYKTLKTKDEKRTLLYRLEKYTTKYLELLGYHIFDLTNEIQIDFS